MSFLTFIILCLEGMLLSFNVASSAALIPSIAADFGVSQFLAGRIVWFYMLPYGIAALVYGPLIRVIDARKVELFCILAFAAANLMAGFAGNISALLTARFFMGLFGASVIPLALILIARHKESGERGKYVGIFFSTTFAASLSGLFLSGIIPWRMIYLIPGVLGLLLSLLMLVYLPSFQKDTGTLKINYAAALKKRTVLLIFTYIFLISLFYHGVQQWLSVFFSGRYAFSQFIISSLITLTSLSGIIGEVLGGRYADSLGRVKIASLGVLLMAISVFILVLKMPVALLAVLMILWGLGWTFNHAGISTLLTDLPFEYLNESASLNSSVRFISGGLGAALGGILIQKGFNIWLVVFGVCILGTPLALNLNKQGEKRWAKIY
jgi:predicted MFS family arabinose efflux permease